MEDEKSIFNRFINMISNFIPFIKLLKDFISRIVNTIPRILKKNNPVILKYIYDMESIIALIITIIIIQNYDKIDLLINTTDNSIIKNNVRPIKSGLLDLRTIESIIYVFSIIILILNVIHITYVNLYNTYDSNIFEMIYNVPLFIIVFFFSLAIFIIINIIKFAIDIFSNIIDVIIYLIDQLSEISNDKERTTVFVKYFLLYIVIFTIIILLFNITNKSDSLNKNTFTYLFFIIIPLILVIYLSTPFSNEQSLSVNTVVTIMIGLFFSIIIYYYLKNNKSSSTILNYISSIVIITFIILALSNIFFILGNYFKSFTGWTGLIINFIFYIPCLVIEFIKYFLNELKITANPIYIILFLELIVILLYIYLPLLLEKINKVNGAVLMPTSSYLDKKMLIGNSSIHQHISPKPEDSNLYISSVMNGNNTLSNWINLNTKKVFNNSNNLEDNLTFNQNYSFSLWIYLNMQSLSENDEIEIFNFGIDNNNVRKGKPRITYYNKNKNNELIRIYFTNQTDKTDPIGFYELKLPSQKWINIVINFSIIKADLFIDGELEHTYYYNNNVPTFDVTDFITIGEENGLNGAICNVIYYPKNLSLIEITNNYNLLMIKNPPIN